MDGCTDGEIIPGVATTNETGKVTVKFKAGNKKGTAILHGWYVHTTPYGVPYAFMAYTLVQIQVPIPTLWMLTAEFSNSLISKQDTAIRFNLGDKPVVREYHSSVNRETSGNLTALIENFAEDRVHDFSFNTEYYEPKLLAVSGTGRQEMFSQKTEVLDGELMNADIRNDNVSGFASQGASIQFDYSSDYKYFGLSIGIKAAGAYLGHMYGSHGNQVEWWNYGDDINDNYLSSGTGGDQGDPLAGCRITKTDYGYLIQISRIEKSNVPSPEGTDYTTITSTLTARLVPYKPNSLLSKQIGK